jgi:proline iminopeptidase
VRTAILGLLLSLGALGCPPAPVAPAPASAALAEGDYAMTVDGIAHAYHVRGRGPVCIVHPGGPGLDWGYLRMPEVERSLTLIYLEPAGTGVSQPLPAPKDYTLARYAQLLDGVRNTLGLPRVCVLGHSHGGMVAIHWAVANPDRVAGLILYDTAARSDPETDKEQDAGAVAYAKEPWFTTAVSALGRQAQITTDTEADAVVRDQAPFLFAEWTKRQGEFLSWHATLRGFVSPMRGAFATHAPWDARVKLSVVKAPTLVIVGAKDWITSPARADELTRAIAGSQLVVLPNSGHMGHVEEPAAFAAAIRELAPKLEAASAPPAGSAAPPSSGSAAPPPPPPPSPPSPPSGGAGSPSGGATPPSSAPASPSGAPAAPSGAPASAPPRDKTPQS